MSKILIIDDERDLVTLLERKLIGNGHEVLTAEDGKTGVELAKRQPDLIILDIMMPGMDGFQVCREIRDQVFCPILFLSARQSEADKIKGLSLGGDDYVTKPFGIRELMARIEANLRRERRSQYVNAQNKRTRLYYGALQVDIQRRVVELEKREISFTKREYEIVELLAMHPGRVFSREQIYEAVWCFDAQGDSNVVAEHMRKIRSKFSEVSQVSYISTVWGIGYRWDAQREEELK